MRTVASAAILAMAAASAAAGGATYRYQSEHDPADEPKTKPREAGPDPRVYRDAKDGTVTKDPPTTEDVARIEAARQRQEAKIAKAAKGYVARNRKEAKGGRG